MEEKPGMAIEASLDLGVLVAAGVVKDDVNDFVDWDRHLDRIVLRNPMNS